MPDHVHMALTPLTNEYTRQTWALADIMGPMKGASSHAVNKLLGRKGTVWQEESFDRVLRSNEDVNEKLSYILHNPVRAGLVKRAREYPWLWTASPTLFDYVPPQP